MMADGNSRLKMLAAFPPAAAVALVRAMKPARLVLCDGDGPGIQAIIDLVHRNPATSGCRITRTRETGAVRIPLAKPRG